MKKVKLFRLIAGLLICILATDQTQILSLAANVQAIDSGIIQLFPLV